MGSKSRKRLTIIFPLRQLRLSFLNSFSLGPGSAVGEKGKKPLTGTNKAVVWGRKRAVAPFPSPDFLSAHFARRFFCLFSPNAQPGPGLQLLMLRIFHVLLKSQLKLKRSSNI